MRGTGNHELPKVTAIAVDINKIMEQLEIKREKFLGFEMRNDQARDDGHPQNNTQK